LEFLFFVPCDFIVIYFCGIILSQRQKWSFMLCHFLQRNHKDKTVAGNRILLEDLGATLCATSETTWNSMLDLLYVLASPSHTVSQSPDALLILFSIPLPHFIPGILNFLLFRQSKWIQLSLSTLKLA
jgi:hypothetical protein